MRQESSPWTSKLSSMFTTKTLIFLGVGVVIGYFIYKRMSKGSSESSGASQAAPGMMPGYPAYRPGMVMPSAAAARPFTPPNIQMPIPNYHPMKGMADMGGGFENLGHYAPGQEACEEADHISAPSVEFEIQ